MATNKNLNSNSTNCINCLQVAQTIQFNIEYQFGNYYSVSVIQNGYGNPFFPYYQERFLSIIIESNNF